METSILFVKILSVYFVVSGLFVVIRGKTFSQILKDFFNHPAIVYLTGAILFFLGAGVLLMNYANPGEGMVAFLGTFFGWVVLLKALAYIFLPSFMERLSQKKWDSWFGILGAIMIILGVWLFFIS